MYRNCFAGFARMFQEEIDKSPPFATTVTRDYLGQNFYWNGQKFPATKTFALDQDGRKMTIQAGTDIGIAPYYANKLKGPPGDDEKIPVEIGNPADPKISTQSDTAHGKPSKYAGNVVLVPYRSFLWMIQPGDPNAVGAGAGPGMPGMTPGMPAGPGAAPMPGGAPGAPGTTPFG